MRIVKSLMMIAVVVLFAACGGGGKTPAAIEKQIWSEIKSGNYDKAMEFMFDNADMGDKQVDAAQLKAAAKMYSGKIEAAVNENGGGIKEFKVISEKIDEEAGTASVEMEITFKDGSTETKSDNFAKIDGKWKIKM